MNQEALQRKIADLEFHMSTGTLCPNLDVERGVRAVLDEVKRVTYDLACQVNCTAQLESNIRFLNERIDAITATAQAENERLKAQIAAYEMPVSDEEVTAATEAGWALRGSMLQIGGFNQIIASRKLPRPR